MTCDPYLNATRMNSTACEMAEILSKNYLNLFRSEAFYRRYIKSAPVSIKMHKIGTCIDQTQKCPKYRFCHPIGQMDLSCPWTVQDEIFHKCRETIPLVQVCFRFELSFTVLKLLSKIGVNPWNFDQIFAVFSVFLREWRPKNFKTTGLFKLH